MSKRKANGSTVRLLRADMTNIGGSEWSVHLLATRRNDGSIMLKVHHVSAGAGPLCQESGP